MKLSQEQKHLLSLIKEKNSLSFQGMKIRGFRVTTLRALVRRNLVKMSVVCNTEVWSLI